MADKTLNILLIECYDIEAKLIKFFLKRIKMKTNLHVVNDGNQARDFLNKKRNYKSKPNPDVVILDLNTANNDGREFLIEMKHNDDFKSIPLVVLTNPEENEEIKLAYGDYANCYVSKPLSIKKFEKTIKSLNSFWLSLAK